MQCSISQISAGPKQLGAAIAAVAALVTAALLFGFAAPASAETADQAAITADVVEVVAEGATSVQPTPPPTAPPPPAGAPEGVEAEAAAPAPSEPAPAASLAEIPVAKSVIQQVPAVREDAARTIESVAHSAGSTAAAVDRAASADRLRALAHDPLRVAGETLRDVTNGLLAREADERSVAPAAVPPDTAAGGPATAHSAPTKHQADPPAILHPLRLSSLLKSMPMRQAGESAGLALSHAESSSLAVSSEVERAPVPTPADALGSRDGGERFENLLPQDGNSPLPLPASLLAGASGAGSSSFVPIVALLALLALVVPAIIRRLREAPDLRAPALFVCALERPG